MYWIAYVTLGLAVGVIIGYVGGRKDGVAEGVARAEEAQRNKDKRRGQKAAETRKLKSLDL